VEVGPSDAAEIRTAPADHFQLPYPSRIEAIASDGMLPFNCTTSLTSIKEKNPVRSFAMSGILASDSQFRGCVHMLGPCETPMRPVEKIRQGRCERHVADMRRGALVKKELRVRFHSCPHCKTEVHRDVNAARNILKRAVAGPWNGNAERNGKGKRRAPTRRTSQRRPSPETSLERLRPRGRRIQNETLTRGFSSFQRSSFLALDQL
jgi:hypothetical protein